MLYSNARCVWMTHRDTVLHIGKGMTVIQKDLRQTQSWKVLQYAFVTLVYLSPTLVIHTHLRGFSVSVSNWMPPGVRSYDLNVIPGLLAWKHPVP